MWLKGPWFVCLIGERVGKFKGQALSTTIWAAVKMGIPLNVTFMTAWQDRALKLFKHANKGINMQDTSNIYWAYGELKKIPPPELLNSLSDRAVELLQARNNDMWVRQDNDIWFAQDEDKRFGQEDDMRFGETIASIFGAHAKFQEAPSQKLLEALEVEAVRLFEDLQFDGQGTANLMWAYTTIRILPCKAIAEGALQQALLFSRGNRLTPQSMANLIWAVAKLAVLNPSAEFFAAFESEVTRQISRFTAQALAKILFGLCLCEVCVFLHSLTTLTTVCTT